MTSQESGPGNHASRETALGSACALLFSISLGISGLAIPLIAVMAGLDLVGIGIIVTIGAAAQLASRIALRPLTLRVRDRQLIALAGVLLAASCVLLAIEFAFVTLVIAQLLQGGARAIFWTSSQTHAVRTSRSAVGGLAPLNFAAGVGQSVGPILAGLILAASEQATMAVAAVIALAIAAPAMALVTLPLPSSTRTRRAPRARTAHDNAPRQRRSHVGWASVAPGGWRALLGSYVPIVLQEAGHSPATIGLLVALSSAASIIGSLAAGRAQTHRLRMLLIIGCIGVGIGLAGSSMLAESALISGALLAASGLSAGLVQTVAPAAAAELAGPDGHNDAIIRSGTFRAAALTLAPLVVAVLAGPFGAAAAVAVSSLLIGLPGTAVGPISPPGATAAPPRA